MSRQLPDPVENVIQSFNEEMDLLAKTWDEWEAQTAELGSSVEAATTPRRPPSDLTNTYLTTTKAPYEVKDPPPTRTKLKSVGTPVEPPPEPVKTPFPASYATPNRHRARTERTKPVDPQDDLLIKMRRALDEQERLIQSLQQENDILREKLRIESVRELREESERLFPLEQLGLDDDQNSHNRVYREDFSANQDVPSSRARRAAHREEPKGRRPPPASTTSTYRTIPLSSPPRSPPRRIHTSSMIPEEENSHILEGFTPGTRLVAKLSTLMKMEHGHHAPLSVILDRHWDQLKPYFDSDYR